MTHDTEQRHFDKKPVGQTGRNRFVRVSKEREEKLSKDLEDIYANSDGSMPDMTQFDGRPSGSLVRAALFFLLACGLLGGAGWYVFFGQTARGSFQEDHVVLTVTGDEKPVAGLPVTYRIRYRNDQVVALTNAEVHVRFPDQFVFATSTRTPSTEQHDTWALGTIGSGDSGYLDVTGVSYASAGTEQSLRTFLTYVPENFHSNFQSAAVAAFTVASPNVSLSLTGPTDLTSGKAVTYTVALTRDPDVSFASTTLLVRLAPSDRFVKTASVPKSDSANPYQWTIVPPTTTSATILSLSGKVAGDTDGADIPLTVSLYGRPAAKSTAEPFLITQTTISLHAVSAPVSASLAVNGSTGETTIVPGKSLVATVAIENKSAAALKNAKVRLVLNAPAYQKKSILDWVKVSDQHDGTVTGEQLSDNSRRATVVWDGSKIPELKSIAPNGTVSIDIDVPVKYINDAGDEYPAGDITGWAEVQYDGVSQPEVVVGSQITIHIISDAHVDVQQKTSRDGDATRYAVTWLLGNTVHPLKNIRLEAELFGDVAWDASALSSGAGSAVFDPATKKLTWTVPTMPLSVDVLPLSFAFSLKNANSTQTQAVSKVHGVATDAVSGKELILAGDAVEIVR